MLWLMNLGFAGGGAVEEAVSAKGGWLPPKYVKTKWRKKDEEILEQVYALVEKLDEVPVPQKLVKRVKIVESRAEKVITLKDSTEHDRQLRNVSAQIGRIEVVLNAHIKAVKQDEDDAIKALLMIL